MFLRMRSMKNLSQKTLMNCMTIKIKLNYKTYFQIDLISNSYNFHCNNLNGSENIRETYITKQTTTRTMLLYCF